MRCEYLGEVNDFARRAMRKLWPGPIGLIFDVPEEVRRQTAQRLGLEKSDLYDGSTFDDCDARTIPCLWTWWER